MRKTHQVMASSRAAIDLASIMIGIIIIGLIGGVIAATVFAVIPWSQDKVAKQQLDSIASAESAYRGLSTSKDANLQNSASSPTSQTDPNQVVLNSTFTGSAGLAANNLLALNDSGQYCVIATTSGKDYHAYSKSGSGKWFYVTSGKTLPVEYVGTTPCATTGVTAGTVDTSVDNGLGDVPTGDTNNTGGGSTTPAPTPVYTSVATYNFEDGSTSIFKNPQTFGSQSVATSPATGHGSKSLYVTGYSDGTVKNTAGKVPNIIVGDKYRVTASIYMKQGKYPDIIAFGSYYTLVTKNQNTALNSWQDYTFEVTAKYSDLTFQGTFNSPGTAEFYVDDIKIEHIS